LAFTPQQKREHRMKAAVRERERQYKHDWDVNNRARKAEYQRRYRSGTVGGGSTTTAPSHLSHCGTQTVPQWNSPTDQRDLFDAGSS
jgi:hypothetical protein